MKKTIAILEFLTLSACYEYAINEPNPPVIFEKERGEWGYYDNMCSGKWFSAPYGYIYYEGEEPYWGDFNRRSWGLKPKFPCKKIDNNHK